MTNTLWCSLLLAPTKREVFATWEQPRTCLQSSLPQVSYVPPRRAEAQSDGEGSSGVMALITVTRGLNCETIV